MIIEIALKNHTRKSHQKITPYRSEMPAGIEVYPTGDFDMYTSLMHNIADTKDTMTYLGFVLIFVFLALAYRQKEAVTPLVPIVCVVGWNAVVMVIIACG